MIIAGAGGHAMELLDVILRDGTPKETISFYDDVNSDRKQIHNQFKVIKNINELQEALQINPQFCIGVGNPKAREKLNSIFVTAGGQFCSIKGNSLLSTYSNLNNGVDVFDYCFIGPNVSVGFGSLLNTRVSIHHHTRIGKYCEVSPGATLLGRIQMGDYCQVGAGSVILPGLSIGNNVIIGAGAVVTSALPNDVVVAGVPAKEISKTTA